MLRNTNLGWTLSKGYTPAIVMRLPGKSWWHLGWHDACLRKPLGQTTLPQGMRHGQAIGAGGGVDRRLFPVQNSVRVPADVLIHCSTFIHAICNTPHWYSGSGIRQEFRPHGLQRDPTKVLTASATIQGPRRHFSHVWSTYPSNGSRCLDPRLPAALECERNRSRCRATKSHPALQHRPHPRCSMHPTQRLIAP